MCVCYINIVIDTKNGRDGVEFDGVPEARVLILGISSLPTPHSSLDIGEKKKFKSNTKDRRQLPGRFNSFYLKMADFASEEFFTGTREG